MIHESEMLFHEVATMFPPMTDEEFQLLVADIEEHGLQEPLWRYQNQIIDGVHRYRACKLLGIEPVYREWDGHGSLVAFVVSCNLVRRHVTSSQRAMIALEVEARLAREASAKEQERKASLQIVATSLPLLPEKPLIHAAEQAAALLATNHTYITDAKKVLQQAPELREKIRGGVLTIPQARTLARLDQPQRQQALQLVETGRVKTAQAAVLEVKKEQRDAQARAEPMKPQVTLASWETWLPAQPPCDLLLTDPPYSTEIADIDTFAQAWLPLALAKVKSTGRAYVCIGAYPREIRAYLNMQGCLPVQQILVWEYRNTLGPKPAHLYKQNWQAILYFSGPEAPPLDCPLLTEQLSVQQINAPDGRMGDRYHTWQKPDNLAEQLIRHSTRPGDRVYDLFCGTGTFLLAAQRLGRLGLGCDETQCLARVNVRETSHDGDEIMSGRRLEPGDRVATFLTMEGDAFDDSLEILCRRRRLFRRGVRR